MKLHQKLAAVGTVVSSLAISVSSALAASPATDNAATGLTITPGQGFAQDTNHYVSTIISVVFVVGALLALAYLIMGGIQWITAAGDKSKTEAARNHITAALIGMLILAGAFAIFQVVMGVLGVGGNAANIGG